MAHETRLEGLVAMYWDRETHNASLFSINMMAACYPQKSSASPLNAPGQILARNGFQTAISTTLPGTEVTEDGRSTERQPSIASRRFAISSSRVSPSVAHPGMAGISAQNPPSSASCTIALNLIDQLLSTRKICLALSICKAPIRQPPTSPRTDPAAGRNVISIDLIPGSRWHNDSRLLLLGESRAKTEQYLDVPSLVSHTPTKRWIPSAASVSVPTAQGGVLLGQQSRKIRQ